MLVLNGQARDPIQTSTDAVVPPNEQRYGSLEILHSTSRLNMRPSKILRVGRLAAMVNGVWFENAVMTLSMPLPAPADVAHIHQGGCSVEPDVPKTMVNSKARRRSYVAAKKGFGFFGSHILVPFIGAGLTITATRATRLARVPPTLQRRVMIALGLPRGLT